MVCDRHCAARAGRLADGDVLVESRRALDGGLVDLLVLPDLICGAVAGESALLGAGLRVADGVFHDVVFY